MFPNPFLSVFLLLMLLPTALAAAAPPLIIWDTRAGKAVGDRALLDRLAQADVVFIGEQHDDAATHALELNLLQGLHRRAGERLVLGMEMFERDVQPALGDFLSGRTNEPAFLIASRPWSNYATDYRPLVEYARSHHIAVVASNAPQPLVSQVGHVGLSALRDAPAGQVAALVQAPHDAYWERFQRVMEAMGGTHGGTTMDAATVDHFYEAQVVRDETMAESIDEALDARPGVRVLHVNGQFHSDFGGGIPQRLLWRRPLTRLAVVSVVPVNTLPKRLLPDDRGRGDFVVYVQVQ